MQNIQQILDEARREIDSSADLLQLEAARVKYLGKKGELTAILKNLGSLSADERPKAGQAVNEVKAQIETLLSAKKQSFLDANLQQQISQEKIDITLPGRGQKIGTLHPVTKVKQRLVELFTSMGFMVVTGPEIEDEFHNFDALNIPAYHPARATSDTFYLDNSNLLLRTQTSPVQIRAIERFGVPLRCVTPGKVFRRDSDLTHVPMFHQLEVLLVDDHTTFSELKGLLYNFLEHFFEAKIELKFRPSYFPFTEPSAEVDLKCVFCKGKGCRVCKETGWIEVFGCGMVHPNVLEAVNIDSEKYTGFAFGIGLERFAMFRYGINDLRILFENDSKFLEQF